MKHQSKFEPSYTALVLGLSPSIYALKLGRFLGSPPPHIGFGSEKSDADFDDHLRIGCLIPILFYLISFTSIQRAPHNWSTVFLENTT